jgi:hypothetical protein
MRNYAFHLLAWALIQVNRGGGKVKFVCGMSHYPLRAPRKTRPMLKLKLKKPPSSLSGSNTSSNRFRISYKIPMTSTSSAMINIGCHISFRWEKKFGYTCRKNAL